MNATEIMRREILRLASASGRSAFISVKRLSDFYHVPEKTVRRELTKLAAEKRIKLAKWDGNEVRPDEENASSEEFVEQSPAGVAVRVDLVE